jgi:predicted CXXCH cytochrome family protein
VRAVVPVCLLLAGGALAGGAWAERRAIDADLGRSRDLHGTAYVGSEACRGCHLEHHASWRRTFHRTMTAEAASNSVRGDFSGATLTSAGVTARMDRDAGGGYRMTFTAPGAPARTVEVARTVGSRRYQQYLAREGDTYWRLPVAWHVEEQHWFPMTSAFLFAEPSKGSEPPPMGSAGRSAPAPDAIADPRPVYGGGEFDRHVTRWNDNCVFCHNVAPNPARDPATGRFTTTVAELGIACEACHGPGAEHVARNGNPFRRWTLASGGAPDPTIVNPARLPPGRAADLCGRCHGQRLADHIDPLLEHGDPFIPGDDLAIESAPLWRDTPLHGDPEAFAARFWADGTPRLTAYEYQGLLQSPCAMRGPLTCTSCHGMHDGDPRGQIRARFGGRTSNAMCTGCHTALAPPAAARQHAHHDPAGEGGRCVSCHMPRIVYGVLDVHRSHRIEVPDPAAAEAAGRPDACTSCHADRSAAWAQQAARRFWGEARFPADVGVPPGTTPLEALFAGPPVARAVAADALGRAPADAEARARRVGALLEVMAHDRFPAVRHLAWRGLRRLVAPGAGPGQGFAADYDPSGTLAERGRTVARLQAVLGGAAQAAATPLVALRAGASESDLEMGE